MTRQIPLINRGVVRGCAMVDDADVGLVMAVARSWYLTKRGYAGSGSPVQFMHRVIMGAIPDGMSVDHINGDKLDNRRSNLRLATQRQQCMNRRTRSDNRLGVRGVSPDGVQFRARITVDGRTLYLGGFATIEEASAARAAAEARLFGEFAPTGRA